jgi:DNA-binding NarL/FixJ family response regulator
VEHAEESGEGLKILVVDDHHLVREGLRLTLSQIDKAAVVLEAETLSRAIEVYTAHPDIDLVLLDLTMPGNTGLTVLDGFERACPEARVVVISASYDLQTVQAAVRRGVLGFIPKLAGKEALLSALRFIMAGGIYVPPEAMMTLPAEQPSTPPEGRRATLAEPPVRIQTPQEVGLTARQVDVLRELLDGKSNKQICRDMNLAMGTVKGHVAAILDVLDVGSRTEAIAAAVKRGWPALLSQTPTQQRVP